jgi:hypothetical protein
MDPIAVLKTYWRYKFWVLPVLLVTLFAGAYVYQLGPRTYESSMSVAIVNPPIPSERELEKKPELDALNKDNPYLRSADPSLITDVIVKMLNSSTTAEDVEAAGLGPEYTVGQGVNSNGFVIDIAGVSKTPESAVKTATLLGQFLERDLREAQKVYGADDSYLYTSLVIAPPDKPTEQFSSRLRSLIVVVLGGGILSFGAVSLGSSIARLKEGRQTSRSYGDQHKGPVRGASDGTAGPPVDPQVTERKHLRNLSEPALDSSPAGDTSKPSGDYMADKRG